MTPETALADYVQSRDPDAFLVLVRQYERLVYSVCLRMLPRADAEDAVQDVFVKLMRHSGQIKSDLTGWIHRCTVNTCRDSLRKSKSRCEREQTYRDSPGLRETGAISQQILAEIDEALLELGESDRVLLTRYFLNGESQQSIGEEWNVHQSTVKRRLDAAIKKLRQKLDRRGVVVAVTAITGAMATTKSQAAVPGSLSTSLSKLTLAAPGLETFHLGVEPAVGVSQMPRIKVLFAIITTLSMASVGLWWLSQKEQAGGISISSQPSRTYFRREVDLTGPVPLGELIQQVQTNLEESGRQPVGPMRFLHPDGLGVGPELSLIIAFEVDALPNVAGDANLLTLPMQTVVSMRLKDGDDFIRAVGLLEEHAKERGFQRTFEDQFITLNAMGSDGYSYEVQLGIRPKE